MKTKKLNLYKHLMSGVSNMLPFVVAGGVMIATAFLVDIGNASTAGAKYGSSTPLANWFLQTGVIGFTLMIPIMSGFIAYSIADRPGFVPGFTGGWLASNGYAPLKVIPSGFLGGILAGFLAGYIINMLKKSTSGLPRKYAGIKPIFIFPLVSTLLIAVLMLGVNIAVGPVQATLQKWLTGLDQASTGSKVLVGLVAGAMAGFDYGGPVNKVAYLAGVGSLAGGQPSILMAAVSAACITPPFAVSLATVLKPKKFTQSLKDGAKANWILGFFHITEGAIPFAAFNPKVVLPATMIGSATAASISALLKVGARAPHGGLAVLPTVVNPTGWVIAIFIGTIVSTLIMITFMKDITEQ